MSSSMDYKKLSFVVLTSAVILLAVSAGLFNFANAYDISGIKPIYNYKQDVLDQGGLPKAMLFASFDERRDIVIVNEFVDICKSYDKVSCLCVDKSGAADSFIKDSLEGIKKSCYVYQDIHPDNSTKPYVLFLDRDNSLYKKMDYSSEFEPKLKSYLAFLNGEYSQTELNNKLADIEKTENMDKIVPRLNLILLLAKKGNKEEALKELDKISINEKSGNKEALLVAEIYLRLQAPEKALETLNYCEGTECDFYRGVSLYLLKDFEKAEDIFKKLEVEGEMKKNVDFYLDKIQKMKGASENED